jgi:hypothetical protein
VAVFFLMLDLSHPICIVVAMSYQPSTFEERIKRVIKATESGGTIRNSGGLLMDSDHNHMRMSLTELRNVILELATQKNSILIRRIDAGGSPTWARK